MRVGQNFTDLQKLAKTGEAQTRAQANIDSATARLAKLEESLATLPGRTPPEVRETVAQILGDTKRQSELIGKLPTAELQSAAFLAVHEHGELLDRKKYVQNDLNEAKDDLAAANKFAAMHKIHPWYAALVAGIADRLTGP